VDAVNVFNWKAFRIIIIFFSNLERSYYQIIFLFYKRHSSCQKLSKTSATVYICRLQTGESSVDIMLGE